LKTESNEKLELIRRSSVKDPSYVKPKIQLTNRYSGMPMNGKGGILDKYYFVTSGKRDTLVIFVDVYNKSELKIPKGLKIND
jgi:hypothetical protein